MFLGVVRLLYVAYVSNVCVVVVSWTYYVYSHANYLSPSESALEQYSCHFHISTFPLLHPTLVGQWVHRIWFHIYACCVYQLSARAFRVNGSQSEATRYEL